MKPAPFRYVAAESLGQALTAKVAGGSEALFLAGGQSLVPAMNFRLARPAMLIDINPLHELDYVRAAGDGGLRIGALARHRTLERDALVAQHAPLVAEAVRQVAHPQIRNRGTLGGNLAHADPASELPAVMLALGARLRARSSRGERWIEASAFFRGPLTTALGPEEMLVEIALPALPPRSGTCFVEVARRRGDYALLGVACVVTLGDDGACTAVGLALCNAGSTPVRSTKAAPALVGRRAGEREIREAARAVAGEIDPPGNVHASAAFRRYLAEVLTRRALQSAVARAQAR
ncbi:MAG TPA: xanthine dehydrogenase family protein subunit M [Burkholderiales bacterium]|nr:xanthine dehydrogenase family protein subunit M [Burkholderiales bacterium]